MQADYKDFHSGFLVETAKRYFIFDYYKGELPKLNPDKPVYVFASHGHQDHYEPKVFELLKQQGIVPKLAILAKDIKEKKYPDGIPVLKAGFHAHYEIFTGCCFCSTGSKAGKTLCRWNIIFSSKGKSKAGVSNALLEPLFHYR